MTKLALILLLGSATLIAGACTGDENNSPAQTRETTGTTTTTAEDETAALKDAARDAVEADHQLSVRVLWTNRVPEMPRATAGPALAELRRSAAQRRRRGIRVKLISERFRIVEFSLDPSFATATATVVSEQRVQPHGRGGKPLGQPVRLRERARLELRRVGDTERFVVWRVVLRP
jgi:hypothetical protein